MHREGNRCQSGTTGLSPTPLATVVEVRRFVNDSIRKLEHGRATIDFVCECGDLRCRELVMLTPQEYDSTDAGSVLAHEV